MPENRLIVIAGPTAVGKTSLSIALAKQLNTEIISFDSRQVYKELSIGTAKPCMDELNQVKHHFINHVSIHTSYNAFQFEMEAVEKVKQLFEKHKTIIAVGGTGLYLQALIEGLDDIPKPSEKEKENIQKQLQTKGKSHFISKLQKFDPDWCTKENLSNTHRFLRAIEVLEISGRPISYFHKKTKMPRPFKSEVWILNMPREQLYNRINQRVDEMIACGLEKEFETLKSFYDLPALNTIAYKEWLLNLPREKIIDLIKQNSRRYAKRQITWFKRIKNSNPLNAIESRQKLVEIILSPNISEK